MLKVQSSKNYDLYDRTFSFAKDCRAFIKKILKTISNIEDCKQLVRSSGSTHANYIEACEAISKKDFLHRIKLCRKEAKESNSWIKLMDVENSQELLDMQKRLANEAIELTKIFGSIIGGKK